MSRIGKLPVNLPAGVEVKISDDNVVSVKSWPVYTGVKSTDEAIRDACAAVTYGKTTAGAVTFYCLDEAPEADIPVIVEVSR